MTQKMWRDSMSSLLQPLLGRPAFRNPKLLRPGLVWSKEDSLLAEKDQVSEHFNRLNARKSIEPHRMHL